MKLGASTKLMKKVIIAAIIVLMFNFVAPNYSRASENDGGDLFKPISEFVCKIGDLVIITLQKLFLGNATIESDDTFHIFYGPENIFSGKIPSFDINFVNPNEIGFKFNVKEDNQLVNKYRYDGSTGYIEDSTIYNKTFNDNDSTESKECENAINAIYNLKDPTTEKDLMTKAEYDSHNMGAIQNNGIVKYIDRDGNVNDSSFSDDIGTITSYNINAPDGTGFVFEINKNTRDGKTTVTLRKRGEAESQKDVDFNTVRDRIFNELLHKVPTSSEYSEVSKKKYSATDGSWTIKIKRNGIIGNDWTGYLYKTKETEVDGTAKESSAKILQPVIAKWYKSLRNISLAGLLSVLIYISIRIILSSVGQDKAKYKKMLKDWVVAICIIFLLQYLMVFILDMTKVLTDIITKSDSDLLQEDVLMSKVRTETSQDESFKTTFAQMVIYIVLVIYTCMFTVTYLKRLIYMAFLTMIAPLIALTYPLDKIKDGQAQAFSMWLREYIFNSLLQVMHILIYTMLVGTSQQLISEGNYIFALVAIGFLKPGEKFFRKMFGFEKAGTISPMGAAASGAMVMNAMNKLTGKAGNTSHNKTEGNSEEKKQTRTAGGPEQMNNSTEAWAKNSNAPLEMERSNTEDRNKIEEKTRETEKVEEKKEEIEENEYKNINENHDLHAEDANKAPDNYDEKNMNNADRLKEWRRTHITEPINNSKTINGVRALVGKKFTAKNMAKFLSKKVLQAGGAVALGTIGLAAGIASGDAGTALKNTAIGVTAGSALGKGIFNKTGNAYETLKEDVKLFRQGYEGTEYEQKEGERQDKEFKNNSENKRFYKTNFNNYKQAMDDAIIARQNGFSDNKEISKMLKLAYEMNPNANEDERKHNVKKMINIAQLSKQISNDAYVNTKRRDDFKEQVRTKLVKNGQPEKESYDKVEEIFKYIGKYKDIDV